MKQRLVILLGVLFLVSLTASAVSADTYDGTKDIDSNFVDPGTGHGGGGGHYVIMHADNGNGNDGVNNGQGNAGTPGYDNQQDGDQPGEHMGSEYTRVPV